MSAGISDADVTSQMCLNRVRGDLSRKRGYLSVVGTGKNQLHGDAMKTMGSIQDESKTG